MDSEHDPADRDFNQRMSARVLFFSDAVFAIVLTLLVLELRAPERMPDAELIAALQALAPKFVAFGASFALIVIFWAAHMAITRRMVVFDWTVAWVNALFLAAIALMPFASALVGENGNFGVGWRVYCGVLVAASVLQTVLALVLMRGGGRLVGGASVREIVWRSMRAISPALAFGAGLVLSLRGEYQLSALCWVLIPPLLGLAQLVAPKRPPR